MSDIPVPVTTDDATGVFVDHRELLFGVVYNMLGSVADTEDVLQETWLSWTARSGAPDGIDNPRAYLVRIAVNQALQRRAAISRRRETYVGPWLPEPLVAADEADAADGPGPAHRVRVAGDAGGPGVADPAGTRGVRAARGLRVRPHRDRGDHRPHPGGRTAAGAPRAGARARPAAAVPGAPAGAAGGDRAVRAGRARRGHRRADGDPRAGRDGVDGRRRQAQAGGAAPRARPGQGGPALQLVREAGRCAGDLELRYRRVNGDDAAVLFEGDSPYAVMVLDLTPEGDRVSGIYVVTNPDKLTHVHREEA